MLLYFVPVYLCTEYTAQQTRHDTLDFEFLETIHRLSHRPATTYSLIRYTTIVINKVFSQKRDSCNTSISRNRRNIVALNKRTFISIIELNVRKSLATQFLLISRNRIRLQLSPSKRNSLRRRRRIIPPVRAVSPDSTSFSFLWKVSRGLPEDSFGIQCTRQVPR